ncbi:MAG: hypothetical protein ACRC8K_00370 [Waterburya sp.]
MTELTKDLSLAQAHSLINSYAFDLGGDDAEKLLKYWLDFYHVSWIRLATIEALYLGRYKTVSIEHILSVWLRLGNPNPHFTYEFERLICRKLPKHLSELSDLTISKTELPVFDSTQANQQNCESTFVAPTVEQAENKQPTVNIPENNSHHEKTIVTESNKTSKSNIPLISNWRIPYQANWSNFTGENKMIDQFIPLPDVSSFFNKLKTFGEEKLERQ